VRGDVGRSYPWRSIMEMHQVRYFLAVAEELNFTRASERCNVTQPSLSRAIKLLEEELGGLLFHRERDSTRLTDLGHMARPYLQSVGICIHAGKLRQTPRRDRSAGR